MTHSFRSRSAWGALLPLAGAALLSLCWLSGCKGKGGAKTDTPEGTAEAFVAEMAKGDTKAAAEHFAYDEEARAQNEDWDTFGEQQRNLIRQKMLEEKATLLDQMKVSFDADTKVGKVTVEGEQAQVELTGKTPMTLQMTQERGAWRIRGL